MRLLPALVNVLHGLAGVVGLVPRHHPERFIHGHRAGRGATKPSVLQPRGVIASTPAAKRPLGHARISPASAIVSSRRCRRSDRSSNRIYLTSCRILARVIVALLEGTPSTGQIMCSLQWSGGELDHQLENR